jgi:hypothetical protein
LVEAFLLFALQLRQAADLHFPKTTALFDVFKGAQIVLGLSLGQFGKNVLQLLVDALVVPAEVGE